MNKTMKNNRDKILAMRSVVGVLSRNQKKDGVRLSAADVKEMIKDKGVVERVYITRGDKEVNESNVKCDKFAGVLINGGIYWIDGNFALISELAEIIYPLGISITPHGSYGSWGWGDDREAMFDSSITKVGEPQDSMFEEGSRWLENTVWAKPNERMFWTVAELQKVLLKTEKDEDKANAKKAARAAKKDSKKTNAKDGKKGDAEDTTTVVAQ